MKYEIIGTLGSLFVIGAFALKGEKRIRIFDCIGAALFVIYGFLINSFSNILLNIVLLAVNAYHLYRLRNDKSDN